MIVDTTSHTSDNEMDEDSGEEEVITTEDWEFTINGNDIIYDLDPKTNNIYSKINSEYIGKRIGDIYDGYYIDYDCNE